MCAVKDDQMCCFLFRFLVATRTRASGGHLPQFPTWLRPTGDPIFFLDSGQGLHEKPSMTKQRVLTQEQGILLHGALLQQSNWNRCAGHSGPESTESSENKRQELQKMGRFAAERFHGEWLVSTLESTRSTLKWRWVTCE